MVHISRTSLPKPLKTNPEDLEPTLSWFLLSGVFNFFRSKSLKTEVQTVFKEGKILTSFRIISHFSPELRELLTSEEIEDILSETSVEKALSLSIFQDFSMNPWMKSAGKSDGNFLLTNSQKFLFKSISDSEFEFLESFIEKYSSYVKENKETFICKVFGVFTLKKFKEWKRRKLRFLMMKFLLQGFDDSDLVFDLKGSTVGRNNFQACQTMNPLKDLNFIESGLRIDLNEKDKERVIHQLTNDCEFLQKLSIIDYSLIVAIKRITSQDRQKGSGFFSKCGEFYYVFGIIDYFTVFGYRKQLEMIFKNSVYGSGVSCCPPDQYASRFMTFIQTIFV
jgi:1-phosphatidylinositol-4-phosphate 5-kinase